MDLVTLAAFAAVAFIGIATPGPTVLLALSNGSRHGFHRATFGMAGAVASDFVLIGAVALGLGALLATSAFWFEAVRWAGAAYLAVLGVMLLRSRGSFEAALDLTVRGTPAALFRRSFLVAVTNPKGYLFFSAFLPQFVVPDAPQVPQYVALALLFAAIDLSVMAAYAAVGARAVRLLEARGALWLDRICGGALLMLAGSLAAWRRAP